MRASNGATATGVYSDRQILEAIETGQIVCHPFDKKQVNPASLNVTLGEWYYTTEYESESNHYNPFDLKDVNLYFAGPFKATKHRAWAEKAHRQLFKNIPEKQQIIVLKPGQRILAHSHEFVGIKAPGASMLLARSTWGRNGVAVCIDAGWGDPGYINRWTLEIHNLNQHHNIVLPVGEQLAQIIFHHTGPVENSYESGGKYQLSGDLQQLIKTWQPESMLPKAYKEGRQPLKKL